jgi:acyl-ACP thioesterase
VSLRPPAEIVPVPDSGRVFGLSMRPGLADCAPSGRMRLDAIARWCQDVASADVADAGVADHAFWILRRTHIRVHRFPVINETCVVRTFCSGVGRLVAERRTVIAPLQTPAAALVDVASLWVHLDPATRRPSNVTQDEIDALATSRYRDRAISHRLTHPRPDPGSGARLFDWHFRRVDTDVADHVNNAVYWEVLEEELLQSAPDPLLAVDAELEFRDGAQPGQAHWMSDAAVGRFLLDAEGGLLATARLEHALARAQDDTGMTPREHAA